MDYAELEQLQTKQKGRGVVYRGCLFEQAYRHLQKCFKEPDSARDWSKITYPDRWDGWYADKRIYVQAGRFSCVFFYWGDLV